jgi:hypothetical protein
MHEGVAGCATDATAEERDAPSAAARKSYCVTDRSVEAARTLLPVDKTATSTKGFDEADYEGKKHNIIRHEVITDGQGRNLRWSACTRRARCPNSAMSSRRQR